MIIQNLQQRADNTSEGSESEGTGGDMRAKLADQNNLKSERDNSLQKKKGRKQDAGADKKGEDKKRSKGNSRLDSCGINAPQL